MKKMKKLFLLISLITLDLALHTTNCFSQTIAIAAGGGYSLFLCNNNIGMSCGNGNKGQLGDGTTIDKSIPVQVNSPDDITAISGGGAHSLFLKNDGTVWACGMNYDGQLGDGTNVDKSTSIQVSSLSGITAISGGYLHSIFLKNDGTVWVCGFNDFGQLGDGTSSNRYIPIQVTSLSGIIAISAGYQHSLFLKNDGTVWACGTNTSGELGDGTTSNKLTPVQVSSLSGITSISAGSSYSLFLKNDGSVWACGNNSYGNLGDGTIGYKSTPIHVSSLSNITAIDAGGHHSIFLKNDGTIWVCGENLYGQLGDGTNVNKSVPVQVSSLSGITDIAAGGTHSLFLKNNGTVWACGYNGAGELGEGTTINKSNPVQVIDLCMTCVPPPAPIAANATICANTATSLSATGTGNLGWYNQAIGGTYLGGGINYSTPILTANTTYYVQDSTCAPSATRKAVLVTVNQLPVVTSNASAANVCEGASVTLTGGGASSYTWSGGVNDGQGFIPNTTTTYTVTGTDGNNCSNTATKTINVNPLPDIATNLSGLTISANQTGAIYQWLDCNGNLPIAGATNSIYTASINGDYAVMITMNGCEDTSTCVNINITGIEKTVENSNQLNVFPNPGNGILTIKSTSEGVYTIKNESGQTIQSFNLNTSNNYTINIKNLSSGIYFIVGFNNNQITNQKVVITK